MLSHHNSFQSSSSKKVKRPSTHQSSSSVNPFNSVIQTTYGSLSSKQLVDSHVLFCAKHSQKQIEKVCLHPSCEQDMLFCTDCYFDSQNHVNNHREYIFNYAEFIKICRDKSLNQQDSLSQDKSFNLIVADLENNVLKYKTHIRREEEKLDLDFDSLIENVTNDINDLRTKLKEKLRAHQDNYQVLCNQLKEETTSLNKESSSNHKLNNDYDSFLINLTSQKNNSCNFKRLITNLKPQILKQLQGEVNKNILGASNWQSANSKLDLSVVKELAGPSQINNVLQSIGSIMNSQPSGGSSISSLGEKGANKFAKSLKDAFNEFQHMTTYKPLYLNKGEANNIYRTYIAEGRKQYFTFLEGLGEFVTLQTNPAAQSNGQFAAINIMGNNSNIANMNGTMQSSCGGLSSPTSQSKISLNSSGKKANALRGSLANFNSLYSSLSVATSELNNQINNEDVVAVQNASFNTQSVRLSDKQRISSFDHLNTIQTGHTKGIVALKVIDSETIISASNDRTVRFFKNHKEVKEITFESDVTSLGTLGQGTPQQILVGLFQSFAVISLLDYALIKTVQCPHESSINQLVGLSDGQTVISVSSDPKLVTYNLFNSDLSNPKKYFEHRDSIYCLEVFPSNKLVASAGKDRAIKVWKLNFYNNFRMNALEKLTLDTSFDNAHSCDVTALRACATYDNILISGGANGDIKIWDIVLGKTIRSIKNVSGWIFGIITFERPHLAQIVNENKRPIIDSWKENAESYSSPKKSSFCSPKKKGYIGLSSNGKSAEKFSSPVSNSNRLTKTHQDQLGNISFLTASFDGAIKIWEATQDAPIISSQSKNIFDCYPFGGLATYRTENTIRLVTSGNKGDTTLNVYAIN